MDTEFTIIHDLNNNNNNIWELQKKKSSHTYKITIHKFTDNTYTELKAHLEEIQSKE